MEEAQVTQFVGWHPHLGDTDCHIRCRNKCRYVSKQSVKTLAITKQAMIVG